MTRPLVAAGLAAALIAAVPARAASPAVGEWRTPESHGRVLIADCGDELCGMVLDSAEIASDPAALDWRNADPALRERRLKGLALFRSLRGQAPLWTGKVYNPMDGHTYRGDVTLLAPDRLRLRGCIVFPLCKTQVWVRAR